MDIHAFLVRNGPCLASVIKDKLLQEGLTPVAARQAISRARGDVLRLDTIQFPKRESFLFLRSQYQTNDFYLKLLDAFKTTGAVEHSFIHAINCLGGQISRTKARIVAACPEVGRKKKLLSQVIAGLVAIGFVEEDRYQVALTSNVVLPSVALDDYRIVEFLNQVMSDSLVLWLKNNGIVSYNAAKQGSVFAGYTWDVSGPSYLLPLVSKTTETISPGFVVADILLQYDISSDQIEFFIRKVEACAFSKRNRPFIPILVGYSFTAEAHRKAKERNIWITTPENLFGSETAVLLTNIVKILKTSALTKKDENIESLRAILQGVAKIEGETNNLRGHFFELLSGNILSNISPSMVILGRKITTKSNIKAEIDVMTVKSDEIIVIECKGYSKDRLVSIDDIDRWENRMAAIYSWIRQDDENSRRSVRFWYWTTSGFDEDAKQKLETIGSSISKYSLETKDGSGVLEFCRELKLTSIVQLLKEHF